MAELSLEQKRALAIATARQRAAWLSQGPSANNPLAMPDYVNQQPDAAATADLIAKARTQRKTSEAADRSGGVDDLARSFSRGALGIGSYLDEMNAGTNALLAPYVDPMIPDSWGMQKLPETDLGARYDHALRIQRQKDEDFDTGHPYQSTAAKLTGGVMTAGALLKKAPIVGKYLLGNTGATLPMRALAATAAGAGTGAIQGFGAGQGDATNRTKQAGLESALGGITGGLMVPAAAGMSKIASKFARQMLGDTSDALSSMSPDARKYILKELADPEKVMKLKSDAAKLGPDAMLADVSPDWLGVARGAATRPGARSAIVNPLNERAATANARLRSDVETNLGVDPVPSQIEHGLDASRGRVARQYGPAFQERTPFDFTPITEDLDRQIGTLRGDAQRALQRVRGMLDNHEVNENGVHEVTNDPSIAFQTRQAIDGLLKTEANPKVINALSDARQMIDDALTQSVPRIKEIDGQYAELARQSEGLTQGRPILNNEASAMRPNELRDMLNQGGQPEGRLIGPSAASTRMRQGTLGEIFRAVGTKANDTTALRNIVRGEGDWNRDKLGMLFGPESADNTLNAIDRETIFGDTANRVTRGSDTAMGSRFGKFLDDTAKSKDIPTDTTVLGVGHKVAKAIARAILQGNPDLNSARVAEDIGGLSVATGQNRDDIIAALLKRGKQNAVDKKRAAALETLLKSGGLTAYPMIPGVRN